MREYLSKVKNYCDILAACGYVLSEEDRILHLLAGVGLEYDSVVVTVTSRTEPYTFADVGALLLSHESRIEQFTVNSDGSTPVVNLVYQNQRK